MEIPSVFGEICVQNIQQGYAIQNGAKKESLGKDFTTSFSTSSFYICKQFLRLDIAAGDRILSEPSAVKYIESPGCPRRSDLDNLVKFHRDLTRPKNPPNGGEL